MTNGRVVVLSLATFAGVLIVMTGVRSNVGIDTIETRNNRVNGNFVNLILLTAKMTDQEIDALVNEFWEDMES